MNTLLHENSCSQTIDNIFFIDVRIALYRAGDVLSNWASDVSTPIQHQIEEMEYDMTFNFLFMFIEREILFGWL